MASYIKYLCLVTPGIIFGLIGYLFFNFPVTIVLDMFVVWVVAQLLYNDIKRDEGQGNKL